jgi:peptide deformylase
MAILPILKYPNPILREISNEIDVFDEDLTQLASDMRETMVSARGIGLAAPQVGKLIRLIIVDNSIPDDPPGTTVLALVNPEIVESIGQQFFEEGCLSVVDYKAPVKRAMTIKVKALDLNGQPMTLELEGYRAVITQHEIDHLDGILFIDHLSRLKRSMYHKRVSRIQTKK